MWLKDALKRDIDVCGPDSNGTPLLFISIKNNVIFSKLLEMCRDRIGSIRSSKGRCILHFICDFPLYSLLRQFIYPSSYVNERDDDGVTPLMLACKNESAVLVKRLLSIGADPHITDGQSKSAPGYAKKVSIKMILLSHMKLERLSNEDLLDGLRFASNNQTLCILNLPGIESRINLDAIIINKNMNLLQYICKKGCSRIVEKLVSLGVNLNTSSESTRMQT